MEIPNQPFEKLREIALGIVQGQIFTDRHVRKPDDMWMAFMTLALYSQEQMEELRAANPGMIYEYYSQIGSGRSVNGYPCFFSHRMLNQHDATVVWDLYDRLKKAMDDAVAPIGEPPSTSACSSPVQSQAANTESSRQAPQGTSSETT